MTGALGRYHEHVDVLGGNYLFEVYVEAVRKGKRRAVFEVLLNTLFIHLCLAFVVNEDHYDVGLFNSLGNRINFKTGSNGLGPGLAALVQADNDLHAAVAQIERMSMSLTAVTDDGHGLVLQNIDVAIRLIVYL